MQGTGKKPIIIALSAVYAENEVENRDAAIKQASKLASTRDADYVIYIPIAIVSPKREVSIENLIDEAKLNG